MPGTDTSYAWDEPAAAFTSLIRVIVCPPDTTQASPSTKASRVLFRDVHVLEVGQLEPLGTYVSWTATFMAPLEDLS